MNTPVFRMTLLSVLLALSGSIGGYSRAMEYRSDMLMQMAAAMPCVPDSLPDGLHLFSDGSGLEKVVRVEYGEVVHIGYNIFDGEVRDELGDLLSDFVERYWLSMDLPIRSQKSPEARMREDKVVFLHGGTFSISQIQSSPSMHVSIDMTEKSAAVTWLGDHDECVCQLVFPLNHELILGRGMKENDRRLPVELAKVRVDSTMIRRYSREDMSLSDGGDMLLLKGGFYQVEDLTCTRYFYPEGEGCPVPVFGPEFPAESIANMLSGLDMDCASDFRMRLRHRIYGFKEQLIDTDVRQMVAYCLSQGCTPYVGIVSLNEEEADVLAVMHNARGGYCHMLRLRFRPDDIALRHGSVAGRLTAFIPTSNVKNLFKEKLIYMEDEQSS